MLRTELQKYQEVLLAKRAAILREGHRPEDLWIVQSAEQIETVQLAGEREFVVRSLEREAKTLMQVDVALKLIEDGAYGVCLECDDEISLKRLKAVPWAVYCLRCQEARDQIGAAESAKPKLAA